MPFDLDERSRTRLKAVHPDLVRVVRRAATMTGGKTGFVITEGARSLARQRQLVDAGASQTMKSRHLIGADGYAKAVDIAVTIAGKVRWDWPLYSSMARLFKAAAKHEKVSIEWGGDWRTFKDGPHFQLPNSKYP